MKNQSTHPTLISAAQIAETPPVFKTHKLNPNALREVKSLGTLAGLSQLGVHLVSISPGRDSTAFHFHHYEEEFVYILSGIGEALIGGETFPVASGDFLGFRKNGAAHMLTNIGAETLVCLVAGQRLEHDVCDYPHHGKRLLINGEIETYINLPT